MLALLTLSASLTFGSATLAEPPPAVTLMACRHEVPDDVHYRLVIHTDLNTSSGDPMGELSVSLQDVADPGATDVPEGAGPYVRCVMQVLGVAEENLPDGV